jgi:outer membrane protein OmpA-like peptidoglycan-associated protein
MRRVLLFLPVCLFFLNQPSWGQNRVSGGTAVVKSFFPAVRWASRVLGVSSETTRSDGGPEGRAVQVLGAPNHLAAQGPTAAAWQPARPDAGEEWIRVAFDTLMPIRQVVVAESAGGGSIQRIILYDPQGREHLVFDSLYTPSGAGNLFRCVLKNFTAYPVASVKVVLNTLRRPGFSQLDAIGISASVMPVDVAIRVSSKAPKPEQVVKENLGEGVNSRARELNPVIAPDGKTLYFTRWGHPDNLGEAIKEDGIPEKLKRQDVWSSALVNNVWQPAVNIGPPINNADHNALCAISTDGKTALLLNRYYPDGRMAAGISTSRRLAGGWTFPVPVEIKNFGQNAARGDTYEYALSGDKRILIIATRPVKGLGGKDLHVSFLQPDGTWSEPKNLGPDVNTAEHENSPFLAADLKTLYFSSKGHPGYGDDDIFVTRRLDESWTRWSVPENLGPGINTPAWDGYLSIPASGEWAYLCSEAGSLGKEDIFRLRLYDAVKPEPVAIVSGNVLNFADKKPLAADVVTEILTGPGSDTLRKSSVQASFDPETGEYKLVLPLQRSYGLVPVKKGFASVSEQIDLTNERRYREIRRNLYLIPLEAGRTMTLNNVFFEQSKFDLLPSSFPELDRVADLLRQNPTLEILLEGHTDNQGDFNLNLKLSEERVRAVKTYLESKGIEARRVQTKGWGATRPIASNVTEETRRRNRRVEFTVLRN